MGKGQLLDIEMAKIIEGKEHGLTIQELSTKFDRSLSTFCRLLQCKFLCKVSMVLALVAL